MARQGGPSCEKLMCGFDILRDFNSVKGESQGMKCVGRQYGKNGKNFEQDCQSGGWREWEYEMSSKDDPKSLNPNWFTVVDFVRIVHKLDPTWSEERVEQDKQMYEDETLPPAQSIPGKGVIRRGHLSALEMMEDKHSFQPTRKLYDKFMGREYSVYFRPTNKGLTVISLEYEICKSMIGVGGRESKDEYLSKIPLGADYVERAIAGYNKKRDSLDRKSNEEIFAIKCIQHALSNGLKLESTDLYFIHQEWRMPTNPSTGKLDLLAVDLKSGELVVIELKSSESKAKKYDKNGRDAWEQVKYYASLLYQKREEYYPFFSRLARAMAMQYNGPDGMKKLELSLDHMPGTRVWWPSDNDKGFSEKESQSDDAMIEKEKTKSDLKRLMGPIPNDSSSFKQMMRKHQGWWRTFVLNEKPGPHPIRKTEKVCNTLPDSLNETRNFLTKKTICVVDETLKDRKQHSPGIIAEERLRTNLLSSQPLCFNFFAELKKDLNLAQEVLSSYFPDITQVHDVMFEYAPQENYIWYKSALDVAFIVQLGSPVGLIGFECKYTDPFSPEGKDKRVYQEIYDESNRFKSGYNDFKDDRYHQLFRNQLLAEALIQNHDYDLVYTGLFCHQDDKGGLQIGQEFQTMLFEGDDRFRIITYKDFLENIQKLDLTWEHREWTMMLWARYCATNLSSNLANSV